jgi:serine/threonine protein kinase
MSFSLTDYEIIDEIGAGAFGTVLRARQKSLGRMVAIKRLMPHHAQDRHDIARFKREAEATASLAHDNIISVLDYAFFDGNYYIVMEYVEGISFDKALARNIPQPQSLFVLWKTAMALASAHDSGVIHRDVKPGNILLGNQGQVKLTDFGLAAFQQELSQRSSMAVTAGTISYMAPEAMVSPKDADAGVDIFSFGCVLYEVLAGRLPFPGKTLGEVSYQVLNQPPAAINAHRSLKPLEDLALQCLNKEREQRPPPQKIIRILSESIGSQHQKINDDLVGFVRNAIGSRPASVASNSAASVPRKEPPAARTRAAVIALSILLVAVLGALAVLTFTRQRHTESLPSLPAYAPPTDSIMEPGGSLKGSSGKAPSPLVGGGQGSEMATLMIQGIRRGDSLFVNDKLVSLPQNQSVVGISLAPGPNLLELRRSDGRKLSRTCEIIPLQFITWDVRGKGNNGR